jgi:Lrp/AsnC family leucine-responsive transcriptional regulator
MTQADNPPALDDLDRRILSILQQDSAISNLELSERVHASPPTCLRRVRRLTELGVIEKQVAILNPDKLGHSLTAICEITLNTQTAEAFEHFECQAAREPAITQCYRVSPGPDFIVVLHVTDMPAYHALAHRLFTGDRNIRNVRSFFSVHRSKFDTRLPI